MAVPPAKNAPPSAPVAGPVSEAVGNPGEAHEGVLHKHTDPFFLAFNEESFDIYELDGKVGDRVFKGAFYLPDPTPKPIVPGTNGFRTRKDGEVLSATWNTAKSRARDTGEIWIDYWRPIPAEFCPKGMEEAGKQGYLRKMACLDPKTKTPGVHHHQIWEVPRAVIRNRPVTFDYQRNLAGLWICSLILDGTLQPVPAELIREHQRGAAKVYARVQTLNLTEGALKPRREHAEARLKLANDAKAAA